MLQTAREAFSHTTLSRHMMIITFSRNIYAIELLTYSQAPVSFGGNRLKRNKYYINKNLMVPIRTPSQGSRNTQQTTCKNQYYLIQLLHLKHNKYVLLFQSKMGIEPAAFLTSIVSCRKNEATSSKLIENFENDCSISYSINFPLFQANAPRFI